MVVYVIILYLFLGLFTFFIFDNIFDWEIPTFRHDEIFYKIFNERWKRIIVRLSWVFLWPVWILLAVVIGLAFLFRDFVDAFTK